MPSIKYGFITINKLSGLKSLSGFKNDLGGVLGKKYASINQLINNENNSRI